MQSKVRFKFGSRAEYDSLPQEEILDNTLYFLLDTNELYRGHIPIGITHYYEGTVEAADRTIQDAIRRIIGNSIPCFGDLIMLQNNHVKEPYMYVKYMSEQNRPVYGWKPLHNDLKGEDIVFSDGESLLDKLDSLTSPSNQLEDIDKNVFTIYYEDEVVTGFTLKDYGTKYYKENDQHQYEAVIVDEEHPWPDNLILQTITVYGKQILAWTFSAEQADLSEIKSSIANLKNIIGRSDRPSTGLIKRIEDLESNHVKEIKIGNTIFTPVIGRITLPVFNGTNDGVVPKPQSNTPENYVLSANGTWIRMSDGARLEWENIS